MSVPMTSPGEESAFDRFFHGPQAAVRPFLLGRILPCLLALDTWMLMIGHAGRYGAAGFNVAHFAWLDRLLPVPSPASYIGLLVLTGLLALFGALFGLGHRLGSALCLLYTLSWASSMLDSYQHHYFLSLVLVCLAAFPTVRESELEATAHQKPPMMSAGFGYPLLACTIAILYGYAAIAKWDDQWLAGHTIRRISRAGELMAPVMEAAAARGFDPERLWGVLSACVIPMEFALGLGYLVCSQQDRVTSPVLSALRWITVALAFCLHAGAEAMALDIGWFSYYMMVLAAVFLLPARALGWLARLWAYPGARIARQLGEVERELASEPSGRAIGFLLTLMGAGMAWYAGHNVGLPGAEAACGIAGAALLGYAVVAIARDRAGALVRPALSTAVAALLMWSAIAQSDVRWDFYRYLGGDQMRRGELEAALETYMTGEAYAPPGQTRKPKIEQLKRRLGK